MWVGGDKKNMRWVIGYMEKEDKFWMEEYEDLHPNPLARITTKFSN